MKKIPAIAVVIAVLAALLIVGGVLIGNAQINAAQAAERAASACAEIPAEHSFSRAYIGCES